MASAELQGLIDELRANPIDAEASAEDLRAWYAATESFEGTTATPVDAGGVPAEWVVAADANPDQRLLYLHGGGYLMGGIDSHREFAGRLSAASAAALLLIDYRLAPENPYPAAVEDAIAALEWMGANGPQGPSRAAATFVAGDSAGGGLALTALIRARETGVRMPDAAVTISAWNDLACTAPSMQTRADVDPMVTEAVLQRMTREYMQGGDPKQPWASPLFADLTGLPPLLMQVGDAEVLLDDTTRAAEKARAAGVDVTVEVFPEMPHIFQTFAAILPEAGPAIDKIGEYLKQHVGAPA